MRTSALAAAALAISSKLDCSFTENYLQFDLCPIFSGTKTITIQTPTPPTLTLDTFVFGLSDYVPHDYTLPTSEQCPQDTRICMISTNTRPDKSSEPPRIVKVVPIAGDLNADPAHSKLDMLIGLGPTPPGLGHPSLQINLHGGYYSALAQQAHIIFLCDQDKPEPTLPELKWQFNGTYVFNWRSKHACATVLDDPKGERPGIPMDDPPTEDNSGLHPPADSGRSISFAFVLFIFSVLLFILYLIHTRTTLFLLLPLPQSWHEHLLFQSRARAQRKQQNEGQGRFITDGELYDLGEEFSPRPKSRLWHFPARLAKSIPILSHGRGFTPLFDTDESDFGVVDSSSSVGSSQGIPLSPAVRSGQEWGPPVFNKGPRTGYGSITSG